MATAGHRPARRRRHRRPPVSRPRRWRRSWRGAAWRCIWRPTSAPRATAGDFPADDDPRDRRRRRRAARLAGRHGRAVALLARACWQASALLGRLQAGAPSSASAAIRRCRRCCAAALRGIPTVIHEQNAVLGRANRLLARRVDGHRDRLPDGARHAAGARSQARRDRQSGAPGGARGGEHRPIAPPAAGRAVQPRWSSAAARARASCRDVVPPAIALLPPAERARLARRAAGARGGRRARARGLCAARRRAPRSRPSSPTCRRGWPRRISSSAAPAPRPSRSSPSSAGPSHPGAAAACARPATRRPMPRRSRRRGAAIVIAQADFTPERLAGELSRAARRPATALTQAAAAAKTRRQARRGRARSPTLVMRRRRDCQQLKETAA